MIRATLTALLTLSATCAFGAEIAAARYVEPTEVYGHGAVADGEHAALRITYEDGAQQTLRLSGAVFEDTAPRLVDLDGDGSPELLTVVSGLRTGAMLQVIDIVDGMAKSVGTSEPIGTAHRWLAVAGVADFDGDGVPEVAYVDRPHLAKMLILMTVRLEDGAAHFSPLAKAKGLTNHHLGSPSIEGGVRNCAGEAPVIVTADSDWSQIIETRWVKGRLSSHAMGAYDGAESLASFLTCD